LARERCSVVYRLLECMLAADRHRLQTIETGDERLLPRAVGRDKPTSLRITLLSCFVVRPTFIPLVSPLFLSVFAKDLRGAMQIKNERTNE